MKTRAFLSGASSVIPLNTYILFFFFLLSVSMALASPPAPPRPAGTHSTSSRRRAGARPGRAGAPPTWLRAAAPHANRMQIACKPYANRPQPAPRRAALRHACGARSAMQMSSGRSPPRPAVAAAAGRRLPDWPQPGQWWGAAGGLARVGGSGSGSGGRAEGGGGAGRPRRGCCGCAARPGAAPTRCPASRPTPASATCRPPWPPSPASPPRPSDSSSVSHRGAWTSATASGGSATSASTRVRGGRPGPGRWGAGTGAGALWPLLPRRLQLS